MRKGNTAIMTNRRTIRFALFALAVGFLICFGAAMPVMAEDVTVNTYQEFLNAMSRATVHEPTIIRVAADISLSNASGVHYGEDITITSAGANSVTLFAYAGREHFHVDSTGKLTLSNITLHGPVTATVNDWLNGGIENFGELTINGGTVITECTGTDGGGIYNAGTLNMNGGLITGNIANYGGGIYNHGNDLNITGGTISGNKADFGGGVYNFLGTVDISGVEISGNFAYIQGGGICTMEDGGTININGGVISGNSANGGSGGIYVKNTAQLTVSDTIFSGNAAPRAYWMTDAADIAVYNAQVTGVTQFSAPPGGNKPFAYAYNNYDINYRKGLTENPIDTVSHTVTFSASFDGGVSAKVHNDDDERIEGRAIAAVYDRKGVLAASAIREFQTPAGDMANITFGIDLNEYPPGDYTCKVFFWDNNYIPLTAAIVY